MTDEDRPTDRKLIRALGRSGQAISASAVVSVAGLTAMRTLEPLSSIPPYGLQWSLRTREKAPF
jgi:hypothetical protein